MKNLFTNGIHNNKLIYIPSTIHNFIAASVNLFLREVEINLEICNQQSLFQMTNNFVLITTNYYYSVTLCSMIYLCFGTETNNEIILRQKYIYLFY